jgi:hypothetical protein
MIPIKIDGKKYSIKAINQLTTAEFIELSKVPELDIIKYISWQTGTEAFFAEVSRTVEKAIGVVPDISLLPKPKWPDYSKLIFTLGQRHQIENSGLTGYELLVFVLAVSQARSLNIDDVNKLRYSYLNMPFTEILPAGFFFYKILRTGKKPGRVFLRRLRARINMQLKSSKQALKD